MTPHETNVHVSGVRLSDGSYVYDVVITGDTQLAATSRKDADLLASGIEALILKHALNTVTLTDNGAWLHDAELGS